MILDREHRPASFYPPSNSQKQEVFSVLQYVYFCTYSSILWWLSEDSGARYT